MYQNLAELLMRLLRKMLNMHMYIYIHIYIYAVKLKTSPIFALFKVKNWSICFVFFFIFENLILPAERKSFFENKQKQQQTKTQFLKLKTGPIMLRNILGPVFNFNLDQFLTLEFCYFFCSFLCFFWGAKTPIFIVFSAKNAKLKETQKTKKDTICEHTCANCSCQNVPFFLHF